MAKVKTPITQRAVIELHSFSDYDKRILEAVGIYRQLMVKVDPSDDTLRSAPLGDLLKWMLSAAISGAPIDAEGMKTRLAQAETKAPAISMAQLESAANACGELNRSKKRRTAKAG